MDPELITIFFETYLKEKKLEYTLKNRIYTIKLDKQHQRLYATPQLICTIDPNISQKKNTSLVGKGTFLFESMVAPYTQEHVFTSLNIKTQKSDLLDVNNRLALTGKPAAMRYKIEELKEHATYLLYEATIQTAEEKTRHILPILIGSQWHIAAQGFEKANFELNTSKNRTESNLSQSIKEGIKILPSILKKEITQAEQKHYNSFEKLQDIQTQNSEDLYKDLQRKELDLLNKIDEAKRKSIEASSFSVKRTWEDKARDLKKKLTELIEKNQQKRGKIKLEFGQQKTELEIRELALSVDVLAAATVEMTLFEVTFADGDVFYYVPAIHRFAKKE